MTNFAGERERYDHDPDARGCVPWARMGRDARATWGLVAMQHRMPLDASGARFNVQSKIVMAVGESDAPVPLRSDPEAEEQGARRTVAADRVLPEVEALRRIRMMWGDRALEVEALMADDDAGRRMARAPKPKTEDADAER